MVMAYPGARAFALTCSVLLVAIASLGVSFSAQARSASEGPELLGVRGDLHFPLYARATNLDGSLPIYKNLNASIEDRVNDLLPRMTLQEKVAQLCASASWQITDVDRT